MLYNFEYLKVWLTQLFGINIFDREIVKIIKSKAHYKKN